MNQFMQKLFEIFKNKMLLGKIHKHIQIVMDHNYMIQILSYKKLELLVFLKILYENFDFFENQFSLFFVII